MATQMDGEVLADLRDHPPHLAKLACGHIECFVCAPIVGWLEWCSTCQDFDIVVDGA